MSRYDKADRVLSVKEKSSGETATYTETTYAYNRFGELEYEKRKLDASTTYSTVNVRDSAGRLSEVWERVKNYSGDGDPSDETVLGNVTVYSNEGTTELIDKLEVRAKSTDNKVTVWDYAYDFQGRRTSAVDGENNETTYTYPCLCQLFVGPPTLLILSFTNLS